jgi:hypothetical protein
VIFNDPSMCSDPCGENDIFVFEGDEISIGENGPVPNMETIEVTQNSVVGATGIVVGDSGEGQFSALLGVADMPGAFWGPSLLNPMGAEVHLVLRTHGQIDPASFDEQISTFMGGCAAEFPNEPCADIQFAVHLPPA